MTRRRLVFVALAVAALWVAGPSPSAAQRADRIDLVGQTTFVTDDPVTFDLRIAGSLDERILNVRVHPPRNDHDELAGLWDEPPGGDEAGLVSRFDITDPASLIVGSDIISITLPDDEIGELLRRESGALPVVIELRDTDGQVLDELVTAVIVEDTRVSSRVQFGFVADARAPFAHQVDTTLAVDPTAVVERVNAVVADAPAPVLVSFTPETLTALADPRTEGGLSAIDSVRTLLDDHLIPLAPWVELDEEAWRRAGEPERIFAQYAIGQATFEDFLGLTPATVVPIDPATNADTLSLLRSIGVTGGIVEPEQLDPLDLERADNRPIDVRDANDVTMPVLPIDRAFEASLAGPDPELIAQQRFTELVLRARDAGTSRAIIVDLATVDLPVLTLLLDLAAGTDRVGVASIDELIDRSPARDAAGSVLRAELVSIDPGDVAAAASDLRLTESVLASYVGMVAPADGPIAPLRTLLEASMSDTLVSDTRRSYTDTVFATVLDGAADFSVSESSRVTLATRSATLPVEIRNDQALPINVIVRITSEKLRLPDGEERALVLEPGLNELSVPVETVASGDARILISVTSPDGRLDLAGGAVNVRSTAVSGLGLIVSLISLAVLLTWWARTFARVRRQRRAASVPDDSSAADDDPSTEAHTDELEEGEPS